MNLQGTSEPPVPSAPELPPASPGIARRLAIMSYDGLVLFAVLFAATVVILPLNRGQAFAPYDLLYSIYLLVAAFFYFAWFWTHGGQTPGMRAWGVRLVGQSEARVSWRESLVRYLSALISLLPFGLGFLWAVVDRENRAWHDRVSGTRLIVQSWSEAESG